MLSGYLPRSIFITIPSFQLYSCHCVRLGLYSMGWGLRLRVQAVERTEKYASTQKSLIPPAVLKSDNANGLFGLETGCSSAPSPLKEGATISCPVSRRRGSHSSVTLTWVVQSLNATTGVWSTASDQFQNATGAILFEGGVRMQVNGRCQILEDT